MFASIMLQPMFNGVDEGPAGGGRCRVWRSFLTDEYRR
jgi:hypothetical protein